MSCPLCSTSCVTCHILLFSHCWNWPGRFGVLLCWFLGCTFLCQDDERRLNEGCWKYMSGNLISKALITRSIHVSFYQFLSNLSCHIWMWLMTRRFRLNYNLVTNVICELCALLHCKSFCDCDVSSCHKRTIQSLGKWVTVGLVYRVPLMHWICMTCQIGLHKKCIYWQSTASSVCTTDSMWLEL